MSAAVQLDHVTKIFKQAKTSHVALDDISLSVAEGEIFGIIGYSGAGKSTLVRMINALERPTSGEVHVFDQDINALASSQLRELRSNIGMIFQQFNLFRSRTVAGNVAYPLKLAGWPKAKREARVKELLEFVNISEKAGNYPDQLSGGQKQRVGIARALATEPRILLADEATSALDPETTNDVLDLLKRVNQDLGITIVVITHEMHVVREIADRVAVMDDGHLVEIGEVYDIFASPHANTTKHFLSTVLTEIPTPAMLETLKHRYPGRLFVADIRNEQAAQRIADAERGFGIHVTIVFGGVTELRGRPFGSFTFEATGDSTAIDRFVADLEQTARTQEVSR